MVSDSSLGIEKLDKLDNYGSWSVQMKFLLIYKGLWTATTGDGASEEDSLKVLALIGRNVKEATLPVNVGQVQEGEGGLECSGSHLQGQDRGEEATTEEGAQQSEEEYHCPSTYQE